MNQDRNLSVQHERTDLGKPSHTLSMIDRGMLEITGVKDVLRFDTSGADLETQMGSLSVEGTELRIEVFDTEKGIVVLKGKFDLLDYYEPLASEHSGKKRGIFGR